MHRSYRTARTLRWLMLVAASGMMPAFFMRCDKAALNFQRGFYQGLGFNVSQMLLESGFVLDQGT